MNLGAFCVTIISSSMPSSGDRAVEARIRVDAIIRCEETNGLIYLAYAGLLSSGEITISPLEKVEKS